MDNYLKLYKKGKEMPATFLNSIRQKGICSWKNEPLRLSRGPSECSGQPAVQGGVFPGGRLPFAGHSGGQVVKADSGAGEISYATGLKYVMIEPPGIPGGRSPD